MSALGASLTAFRRASRAWLLPDCLCSDTLGEGDDRGPCLGCPQGRDRFETESGEARRALTGLPNSRILSAHYMAENGIDPDEVLLK